MLNAAVSPAAVKSKIQETNKARSHTYTQAQATQPFYRGPPSPIPTAFQQVMGPEPGL